MALTQSSSVVLSDVSKQIGEEFLPMKLDEKIVRPATVHLFDTALFVGLWAVLRETVIVEGNFPRAYKEVLASFVSKSNACKFCAYAHKMFAFGSGLNDFDHSIKKALDTAAPNIISDKKLAKICDWVFTANNKQTIKKDVPFSKIEAAEILGVCFIFNYINRVVDIMVSRDESLPGQPSLMRYLIANNAFVRDLIWWTTRGFALSKLLPSSEIKGGQSAKFHGCDASMLPSGFEWCQSNLNIAAAFGAFSAAIEKLGEKYVPKKVQESVKKFISQEYEGAPLSRIWVDQYVKNNVQNMPEAELFATKYMIFISAARFQVDDQYEDKLREYYPLQDQRRTMCMWAAFHTAQKTAQWQWQSVLASQNH